MSSRHFLELVLYFSFNLFWDYLHIWRITGELEQVVETRATCDSTAVCSLTAAGSWWRLRRCKTSRPVRLVHHAYCQPGRILVHFHQR